MIWHWERATGSAQMTPLERRSIDLRLLAGLWVAIVVSALLFMVVVPRPVFDDASNLQDVNHYSQDGVTMETIKHQVNPAGPFSYVWIGLNGKLMGGTLWAFRLVNALSFISLGGILLWYGMRYSVILMSICTLLVNPYLPLASATILTEVPSLLALTLGVLLWLEGLADIFADRGEHIGTGSLRIAKCIFGGMLLGIAITGRQYYLAILPSMAITFVIYWRRETNGFRTLGEVAVLISAAIAVLPIFALFVLWGGLTPPNTQTNISYSNFTATIGVNLVRPVTALLLIGIYFLPVLALQRDVSVRVLCSVTPKAAIMAVLITILIPQDYLWCIPGTTNVCGPIGGLHRLAFARSPYLALTYNAIVSFFGSSGLFLLKRAIWSECTSITQIAVAPFGLSFLTFFVVEQFFVGGTIPFYERYILQIAPFMGMALANNRHLSIGRALIGSAPLLIYGQYRLWQNF